MYVVYTVQLYFHPVFILETLPFPLPPNFYSTQSGYINEKLGKEPTKTQSRFRSRKITMIKKTKGKKSSLIHIVHRICIPNPTISYRITSKKIICIESDVHVSPRIEVFLYLFNGILRFRQFWARIATTEWLILIVLFLYFLFY